eukprot:comp24109_c0_seq1/m.43611 comp24109_c0_seq1/g.43611  ORF comp24109_c0_seq1/g.43611 comp24109_c0_seq1/m.43611 type:complete len:597 (-) comp24109_c0_seq1:621-2411(-)
MNGSASKPRGSYIPTPVFMLAGAAFATLVTLVVYVGVSTRLDGVPQLSTIFYPTSGTTTTVDSQNEKSAQYALDEGKGMNLSQKKGEISTVENATIEATRQNVNAKSALKEDAKDSDGEEEEVPDFSVSGNPFELQSDFPRLNGTLYPMAALGPSQFFCEHETCVIENVCVDHAKDDDWFSLNPLPTFPNMTFLSKGHLLTFNLSHRQPDQQLVKVVKGSTHLFTLDSANWFISILKAFSLRRVADISPGRAQPFNMVLSHKPLFGVDLRKPYVQPYRAIHPTYAPIYDLRESLHGGESIITCFERAIIGYEYRGQMLTGFNRAHLHEDIIPSLTEKVKGGDKYPLSLRAYATRLLEINATLATDLIEFKQILLRRFGKEDVPMQPKTALLVARRAERKSTGLPPYRQLLNLDALVSVLESNGYNVTVAEFTGMSVPEQMEMCRRTSLFIAMHGAGMANIMWLHRQAVVLELHTYGFQKYGYETFASYLGQPYVGWVNEHVENTRTTWHSEKFPRDNPNFWRSRDQIVDVKEFTKAVLRGQALSDRMTMSQLETDIKPTVPPLGRDDVMKKLWARKGIYGVIKGLGPGVVDSSKSS